MGILFIGFLCASFGLPILPSGFAYLLLRERLKHVAITIAVGNVLVTWFSLANIILNPGSLPSGEIGNSFPVLLEKATGVSVIIIAASIAIRIILAFLPAKVTIVKRVSGIDLALKYAAIFSLLIPQLMLILPFFFARPRHEDSSRAFKEAVIIYLIAFSVSILSCFAALQWAFAVKS